MRRRPASGVAGSGSGGRFFSFSLLSSPPAVAEKRRRVAVVCARVGGLVWCWPGRVRGAWRLLQLDLALARCCGLGSPGIWLGGGCGAARRGSASERAGFLSRSRSSGGRAGRPGDPRLGDRGFFSTAVVCASHAAAVPPRVRNGDGSWLRLLPFTMPDLAVEIFG